MQQNKYDQESNYVVEFRYIGASMCFKIAKITQLR